jgi:CubicO group peptidase (beta-lactamase class C family)
MKTIRHLLAASLAAAIALGSAMPVFARPAIIASAQPAAPDLDKIDHFIERALADHGMPGAALVIVHNGEIVHMRGFGVADNQGRAVTPQMPFRIGSSSKSFTALAIMQLAEQGKLDLQAPVQHYLPWFRLADADASANITIAHLLYQTSGIPSEANTAYLADTQSSLVQYGLALQTVALDRPVGSSYAYSNANFNLLGLVIEAVSGQPYADYLQQHIFTPLHMSHSFATPQSQGQGELSGGFQWFFGLPVATPDRFSPSNLPAGFLSVSAEDMGHYLIAQLNRGRYKDARILSPEGIAMLHTGGPNALINPSGGETSKSGSYAMGWVDGMIYGVPAVWHNGDDSRFGSIMVMAKTGWGMALMVNSSNPLSELEPTEYLFSGATRLLGGLEPNDIGLPYVGTVYLVFNSILFALSVLLLAGALRLPAWNRRLRRSLPGRPVWRSVLSGLRVAGELLLAVAIIIGVPALISSWDLLFFGVPDLGGWLAAASAVLMASGLTRGVLLTRALFQARAGEPLLSGAI